MSQENTPITVCHCGETIIVGVGCGDCRHRERQRLKKILQKLKNAISEKNIVVESK